MALFDAQQNAGQRIAEAVMSARSRVPGMVRPPLLEQQDEPVFELGTQLPYAPGNFGDGPTYLPTFAQAPQQASPLGGIGGLPMQQGGASPGGQAPGGGLFDGLTTGLQAARTASSLPGYADTLAPLWEAPNPGIGLNTIFSGQGPGSVAGGIDSAVNSALGSGGIFGAAVPAAAVPGGATAATIGGIGNSAATAAFNPAWAGGGSAALAALPLALPFLGQSLFGKGNPEWNPEEAAQGLNQVVSGYQANPDPSADELQAAQRFLDEQEATRAAQPWAEGSPNWRPADTRTAEEVARANRLTDLGGLAFGAAPGFRGEQGPGTGRHGQLWQQFHNLVTPEAKQYIIDNEQAYRDAWGAGQRFYGGSGGLGGP